MIQANCPAVKPILSELLVQWQALEDSGACRLWITCTDEAMDAAVRRIRKTQNALILRVFGAGMRGGLPWIPTVLDQLPIDEIVLCGHSTCSAMPNDSDDRREERAPDHLLRGVVARMARNDRARRLIAHQRATLQADARIAAAVHTGKLRVTGMLYLEESGAFTVYAPETGKFTAVGS